MADSNQWLTWRTANGDSFSVGARMITPQAQALTVRWLGGGLVWNRPVAILVEQEGVTTRVPIGDLTRRWQVALFGFVLVAMLTAYLARSSQKEKNDE